MMISELSQLFLAYGCLGLLLEVLFTGIASAIQGDARAKSQTYLWMLPIYGLAGLALDGVHTFLHWPWFPLAFVYLGVVYAIEFSSGWVLTRVIGRCPWNYGLSQWTPWGLINLKYAPFWWLLCAAFNPVSVFLTKAVALLARVTM